MEIIQDWLEGDCDYTFGVAIYGDLPKHNRNLLLMFKKKDNTINREKLKHELQKFLNAPAPVLAVAKVAPLKITSVETAILANENKQALFFHQLPAELQPVLLEANQLFKENCFLKVQLNDLPQHAEKKAIEIQLQIHRNFEQNTLCWKRIDHFLIHRVLPKVLSLSNHEILTPAGLLRRQQLLYASISKLNSRLKDSNEKLPFAVYVADKSKLERLIMKQEENLLKQNQELITISKLIDG